MEFKRKAQTQIAEGILANINKGTEEDAAGGVGGEKAVQDKQSDPQNQSCYREKNSSGRSNLNILVEEDDEGQRLKKPVRCCQT